MLQVLHKREKLFDMALSSTLTDDLSTSDQFLNVYLEAVEEFPDDLSRQISKYRELKVKSIHILHVIETAIDQSGDDSKIADVSLACRLLECYKKVQQEMKNSADEINRLISNVATSLNEAAVASKPKSVVKHEDQVKSPASVHEDVVVQKVPLKRGRKSKKPVHLPKDQIEGLDMLANVAITLVKPEVNEEPVKTKKIPITKWKGKSRKRAKNSEASDSKGGEDIDEQSDDVEGTDESGNKPDEDLFCVCNKPSFGRMVCCDNESCSIEWFHFECVNLKKDPPGKWFCPKCRGRKSNVLKKELEATSVKYQKYTRNNRFSIG